LGRKANVIFVDRTLGNADGEKVGAQLDLLPCSEIKFHRGGMTSKVATFGPIIGTRRHGILSQGERLERGYESILSGIGEPRVDDGGLTLGEDTTATSTAYRPRATTTSEGATASVATRTAPTTESGTTNTPTAFLTTSTSTASLHDLVWWKGLKGEE